MFPGVRAPWKAEKELRAQLQAEQDQALRAVRTEAAAKLERARAELETELGRAHSSGLADSRRQLDAAKDAKGRYFAGT